MVIACGSPAASEGGGGNGSEESDTPAASVDGGGGGNGGDGGDVDQLANDLVPPNSTEASRFEAEGSLLVGYTSTDSVDSLKSYYENKFNELGVNVIGTSSAGNTHTFVIGNEDGSGVQGGVTVAADENAGNTIVQITLGVGQ
ncbi:MAG TPA: hypothetical protein VGB34_07400 [Candidatus Limnocylindria bacterium]|jgi:hypothetical protein